MGGLELTLMLEDYHRTHAFHEGKISIDGLKLKTLRPAARGQACYRPVYEEYDVAEMSLSWYVMARCRDEPVVALPIFPLRMFIQPYIFCSQASKINNPEDLKGKRIAIQQYRLTVGLWARGILEEHYGVAPSDMVWATSEAEGAGYVVPEKVRLEVMGKDAEQMLLNGEADALIAPNVPQSFRERDFRIRRLFKDCRPTVIEYYNKAGIFPMTHTLVIRKALINSQPWIAAKLVDAFREADRQCQSSYEYPKRLSYPTAVLLMEEEEVFGKNPWEHGLRYNERALEKFIEYAYNQNYIPYRPGLRELFVGEGECLR